MSADRPVGYASHSSETRRSGRSKYNDQTIECFRLVARTRMDDGTRLNVVVSQNRHAESSCSPGRSLFQISPHRPIDRARGPRVDWGNLHSGYFKIWAPRHDWHPSTNDGARLTVSPSIQTTALHCETRACGQHPAHAKNLSFPENSSLAACSVHGSVRVHLLAGKKNGGFASLDLPSGPSGLACARILALKGPRAMKSKRWQS
jgi:hypothetical protein